MFNWYKELLGISYEFREKRMAMQRELRQCESCEILKQQLEITNLEKNKLLGRLLEKPEPEVAPKLVEVTRPTNIPWNVRRQMLEAEDRERARLIKSAPIPTETLEEELDVAREKREAQR
jgi:hypothetical protein